MAQLFQGDCLELLREIPDGSVDLVLTDPPYGVTQCEWDVCVDFSSLWPELLRVAKQNAAMVVFACQPFAADAIHSNRKLFRYEWIWKKTMPVGFLNSHKMPLRAHENILVFYQKLPTYHPQFTKGEPYQKRRSNSGNVYGKRKMDAYQATYGAHRYPVDIIEFSNQHGFLFGKSEKANAHPTQKPVDLLEYLVNTYTDPGETVLDCFMGSGSTGVACANTGRNFIGMELDEHYFEVAKRRIEEAEE